MGYTLPGVGLMNEKACTFFFFLQRARGWEWPSAINEDQPKQLPVLPSDGVCSGREMEIVSIACAFVLLCEVMAERMHTWGSREGREKCLWKKQNQKSNLSSNLPTQTSFSHKTNPSGPPLNPGLRSLL